MYNIFKKFSTIIVTISLVFLLSNCSSTNNTSNNTSAAAANHMNDSEGGIEVYKSKCKVGCKKSCCSKKSCDARKGKKHCKKSYNSKCGKKRCGGKACKTSCKKKCSVKNNRSCDCKKSCCGKKSCDAKNCNKKSSCSKKKTCKVGCKKSCCSKKRTCGTKTPKSVSFKNLKNGAIVKSPLKVEFNVSGMDVKEAGEAVENTGHHHLVFNYGPVAKEKVVIADSHHIHFGKGETSATIELKPGVYNLTLQFADGLHQSYGPEMSQTVNFTVVK